MLWIKETAGTYKLKLTPDLVCIVHWNLLKRDIVKRKHFNKEKEIHQLLNSSQQQSKYIGIVRGDEHNKQFYSNNLILLQKLTINHAKQIIKERIKNYTNIINSI